MPVVAELSDRLELFPAERFSLYINCRPCRESGLPAGIVPVAPLSLLDAIRSVTHSLAGLSVPAADLKAYKEALLNEMDSRREDPAAVIDDVLVRYSEGKDLVTDYKAAIQRVSAESVARFVAQLCAGAEVEYIII